MLKTTAHIARRRNRRNANGAFGLGTTTPDYAWDFVNNKARFNSINYGALSNTPNWTFTRASTGYAQTSGGVLQSFATGVLRRTDKGALIEGARTNLCLQSQTFDNASWTKGNVTIAADAAIAPDGTLTADKAEVASTASTQLAQNITVAATTITYTVYAKKGSGATDANTFFIYNNTAASDLLGVRLNFDTGALTYTFGSSGASVTALANGWYRIAMTVAAGITSGDSIRVYTVGSGASLTAGQYVYLWGAQLEATAYASSYIPTTTGSATRAADFLTVTGVSGLDYPLTLYAEFEVGGAAADQRILAVHTGDTTNRVLLYLANNVPTFQNRSGGVTQTGINIGSAATSGSQVKFAGRVSLDDNQAARGGTLGTQDTSATNPSAPTVIDFTNGGQQINGYLRRAAIYSRALTDAELQAVTR